MTRNLLCLCCLLALALPLSSCRTMEELAITADHVVSDIFKRNDVNLNEKSYAAADYLEQQIKHYVSKGASISTDDLTLAREPGVTSDLGGLVPDQVGERLRQLGYNVKPADWAEKGDYVLGGTYDRDREHATVNLVMTQASTGKTVGSFTYMMPINAEIKRLAEPKPRIIRITE